MSTGSQTDFPQNPSSDYAEVQNTQRLGQSTASDEAEAGVKVRSLFTHFGVIIAHIVASSSLSLFRARRMLPRSKVPPSQMHPLMVNTRKVLRASGAQLTLTTVSANSAKRRFLAVARISLVVERGNRNQRGRTGRSHKL
jgi:hypothetical protein